MLTGEEPTPGYWGGIILGGTPENEKGGKHFFEHTIIEYGGAEGANVVATKHAYAQFYDCTFRNSSGYGISIDSNVSANWVNSDLLEVNSFSSNALGSVGP